MSAVSVQGFDTNGCEMVLVMVLVMTDGDGDGDGVGAGNTEGK